MICLTGDIHQTPHPRSMDQPYTGITEAECGLEYARIASTYGVKVTYFITGKAAIKEHSTLKNILALGNAEYGGHTFDARERRKWIYNLSYRFLGLSMGPRFFQSADINKTIKAFKKQLSVDTLSWRSHAYSYDRNTTNLLKSKGIRYISSDVEPDLTHPIKEDNVYKLPINILPDHDHMAHGYYTEDVLRNQSLSLDKFSNKYVYSPNDWLDVVKEQTRSIINKDGVAVLLVHPICQKIANEYETFKKLCLFLSRFKTLFVSEISDYIK